MSQPHTEQEQQHTHCCSCSVTHDRQHNRQQTQFIVNEFVRRLIVVAFNKQTKRTHAHTSGTGTNLNRTNDPLRKAEMYRVRYFRSRPYEHDEPRRGECCKCNRRTERTSGGNTKHRPRENKTGGTTKVHPAHRTFHPAAIPAPPPTGHPLGIGRVSRDHFHNFGPLGRSVPYLARLVPF